MTADSRPDLETVFDYYNARIIASSGEWQKACCPLLAHEDQTPSASVNLDAGKWQCWSCDTKGDAYDVVKENENLAGFADAKRWCQENLAVGSRDVRTERVPSGGLSPRSRNRGERGAFTPPWKGL